MKRKDLEAMDLSKEVIDKIMEMNGDDIEELKKSEGDLKLKISALEADNVSLNDPQAQTG